MIHVDPTVVRLTARSLLGRRRALVLLALPVLLLAVAVLVRVVAGQDDDTTRSLLGGFGLGTLVPLLGVLVGTGAIGSEIDDGSIVYLLAKPLSRHVIVRSKLLVAVTAALVLGALPVLVAGLVLSGGSGRLAVGYALAAAAAGVAYCALFLLLAVTTRNAVVVGLVYALVWETTVAGLVPGARALSVRQWSLALTQRVSAGVTSAVALAPAAVLLVLLAAGATWGAGAALRRLRLSGDA